MDSGKPLAYFITFRAYASWLHGDERGSVDRDHNAPGTPMLKPDPRREIRERSMASRAAASLNAASRNVVDATIRAICEHNDWSLHALNVRTNHVHLVVSAPRTPEQVMRSLKSWCTRRLREARLLGAAEDVWSRHGSTRYLWKPEAVTSACRYVMEGQGQDL